jgi:hypothetical protein
MQAAAVIDLSWAITVSVAKSYSQQPLAQALSDLAA